jgi:hypothetical protein
MPSPVQGDGDGDGGEGGFCGVEKKLRPLTV